MAGGLGSDSPTVIDYARSRSAISSGRPSTHCSMPATRAWFLTTSETWIVRRRGVDRFESQPAVRGVRILPPRDPYLLDRDRTTLIPDRDVQREIWRATPVDGLVLIDGAPAATWRPKKTGQRFALQVRAFGALPKDAVVSLRSEAAAIATHRGCTTSEVVIT